MISSPRWGISTPSIWLTSTLGFSDIDLVYGQLRGYFSEERLARYDLLSTHARRVSGHLCLLRNNERMRQAFMRVHGWQACFEDPSTAHSMKRRSADCSFGEKLARGTSVGGRSLQSVASLQ